MSRHASSVRKAPGSNFSDGRPAAFAVKLLGLKWRWPAVVALLLAGLGLTSCTLLEVTILNHRDLTEFHVDGEHLYMANEINSRTLDQFNEAMAGHPEIKTLVMTIVPGSVDDEVNLQLGERVRELGLATHLVAGGMIASGGVDLFLAGVERTLGPGAFVGVHSWASGFAKTGADVPRDDPQHRLYLDYYKTIGVSEDFYWFTLEVAPAGGMHWMTLDEVEKYEMATGPLKQHSDEAGPFHEKILDLRQEIEGKLEDSPLPVDRDR